MDPKTRSRTSKLFSLSPAELKDEDDKKWEAAYDWMQSKLNGLAEKDALNTLVSIVSQDGLNDVTLGLLYGILTEPSQGAKYMRQLTQITNDGWNMCLTQINYFMMEKFSKMLDTSRQQMLWLLSEAVRNQVPLMDKVMLIALRLVQGGDISSENLRLADLILNIFLENEKWMMNLEKNYLVPCSVYTYLRMIVDHSQPNLTSLREKEVKFCAKMLRERFQACLHIGRDLARLLIMVGKIPEFNEIWSDILHNPTKLAPSFTGIDELLNSRGNCKWFIAQRLSVDVERKVCFMLKHVPPIGHERHVAWFTKAHLSAAQSHTLRADMIRFICVCGEESTAKEGLPRWQLLNAILPSNMPPVESQMCKLALCWDWLFFSSSNPPLTVSSIEPVYSLMLKCLKTHSALSMTLLDFLARAPAQLLPTAAPKIRQGVIGGFRALHDSPLVPTLGTLLESPNLDRKLVSFLRETLPELFEPVTVENEPALVVDLSQDLIADDGSLASFSDDEEITQDIVNLVTKSMDKSAKADPATLQKPAIKKSKPGRPKKSVSPEPPEDNQLQPPELPPEVGQAKGLIPIEEILPNLDERFSELVKNMQESKNNEASCNAMQSLLIEVVREDIELTQEESENLAQCICSLLDSFFQGHKLPADFSDEEALHEALQKPLFVIFRIAQHYTEDDGAALFDLLTEMQLRQKRMGYLFLYFLSCPNEAATGKEKVYQNLAEAREKSVEEALLEDVQNCEQLDLSLFATVARFVYSTFVTAATTSSKLLQLVVSVADPVFMAQLVGDILEEKMVIFKRDTITQMLTASLKWTTLEQYWTWQLVAAQDVSFEWMLNLVPKLEWPRHAEAMTNLLLVIRRLEKDPTTPMLRAVLARDPNNQNDLFALRALKLLIDYDSDRVAEVIHTLMPKLLDPTKSKKGQKGYVGINQVLSHMDALRRHCFEQRTRNNVYAFFTKDTLHQALRIVQRSCNSGVKAQFSEFFAAMEILDSARTREKSSRRLAKNKHARNEADSSEEEQSRPSKKRTRVADSDSD